MTILLMYGLTLSHNPTGDDIQKVMIVENAMAESPLWHPASLLDPVIPNGSGEMVHHRYFLDVPLAVQFTRVLRNLDWAEKALMPTQIIHLLFGVLGVLGLYAGLLRLTSPSMAFVLSLGLATGYGWWYYSTYPDFVPAGSTFLTIALAFLVSLLGVKDRRRVMWTAIGLGVSMALAILFYLTSAIILPVLLFAFWLRFWRDLRSPRQGLLAVSVFGVAMLLTTFVISGTFLVLMDRE